MVHFACILTYAYPLDSEKNSKMDYYSFWYVYPYYKQDWRLFTPCPDFNFRICAAYRVNNEMHYSQPLVEALHQRNLFTGKEFLMLTLSNASGYFARDPSEKNRSILRTAIYRYLNNKHNSTISDLHILVELTEIKTNKVNHFYYE